MSVQSEPSKTKGLSTKSCEYRRTQSCHRSPRLCIAHMMSTVLSVYTHPVKTDSKTRGVHNDVSSPSVAQQSDRPGSWNESKLQRQPPNGWKSGRRHANINTYRWVKQTRGLYDTYQRPTKGQNPRPKTAKRKTTIQHIRILHK